MVFLHFCLLQSGRCSGSHFAGLQIPDNVKISSGPSCHSCSIHGQSHWSFVCCTPPPFALLLIFASNVFANSVFQFRILTELNNFEHCKEGKFGERVRPQLFPVPQFALLIN